MKSGMLNVSKNVWILSPDMGPDVGAVMAAKSSRAAHLPKRFEELVAAAGCEPEQWDWQQPPKAVEDFLALNLAGYSHASIGEMAPVWVYAEGMGWPLAWLLLDFPRVICQENSSRVIDQHHVPERLNICEGADPRLQRLHDAWMAFYDGLPSEKVDGASGKSRAYKFDDRRFALPGTMRTGVGYFGAPARDVVRHLERMEHLSGWVKDWADQYLEGVAAYAPATSKSLRRGARDDAMGHWNVRLHDLGGAADWDGHAVGMVSAQEGVRLQLAHFSSVQGAGAYAHALAYAEPRKGPRSYLDPLYARTPQLDVVQYVSVGTARDEHRHRPLMPFDMSPVVNGDAVVFAPWTPFEVPADLAALTSELFFELWHEATTKAAKWQALHALPFCALLRLEYQADLPNLVYKAELRASTSNAHWEYKAQNTRILELLAQKLPQEVIEREKITSHL
jgi:hypothetical protein